MKNMLYIFYKCYVIETVLIANRVFNLYVVIDSKFSNDFY